MAEGLLGSKDTSTPEFRKALVNPCCLNLVTTPFQNAPFPQCRTLHNNKGGTVTDAQKEK